ncbi:DUF6266 family protein [Pedobacter psychroterrae]|uniref:Uncharacterized protein n=1 Tax=Pedobacter psychroterrae TaxID=2530453 RepID=A0A4V2MLD7_9SPHI|nr:DUF6266 family protein [Pedobacter psychroterrae]TCD01667.1 hypothetical protein EZ437_13185 [Pedobacter psychroterrae]
MDVISCPDNTLYKSEPTGYQSKLSTLIDLSCSSIEKGDSANNCARSYNLKHAIKGEYPDQEIDYPALRLSEGNLALPLNASVESTAEGFRLHGTTTINKIPTAAPTTVPC